MACEAEACGFLGSRPGFLKEGDQHSCGFRVPKGTNLDVIPLVAETWATGPAILQGFVTANTATAGANADVSLAALWNIYVSSSVTRQLTFSLLYER